MWSVKSINMFLLEYQNKTLMLSSKYNFFRWNWLFCLDDTKNTDKAQINSQ